MKRFVKSRRFRKVLDRETEAGFHENTPEAGRVSRSRQRLAAPLLVALLGMSVVLAFFLARARRVGVVDEDAYISFRYARNLLNGDGLVFNAGGEKVEGITNLLWTLAVAGGSWVSGFSLPEVAVALGLSCGAMTLLVAYRWCYEELAVGGLPVSAASLAALAPPSLLVLAPGSAYYAASGLEVPLFALLVSSGLYFTTRSYDARLLALGGLLLGAAFMTRPEGGLALVFAAAACFFRPGWGRVRRTLAVAVPGFAVLGAVTLWRLYYYGALVPNTAFAKAGGFEVIERWGLPYLIQGAQDNWFPLAWALALCGALVDWKFALRGLAVLALLPAWCAYIAYVGGDYMPFHRFLMPVLPAVYVVAVAGLARMCRTFIGYSAGASFAIRAALCAAAIGVGAYLFVGQVPEQLAAEEEQKEYIQDSTQSRREVAEWFAENHPDALVARNAVGAFGYYSEVPIVDMLGLNNEHIARHGTKEPEFLPGHQAGDGEYVLAREPDYIMPTSLEPPFRFVSDRELASSSEFWREYRRVEVSLEDGRKVHMFKREDACAENTGRVQPTRQSSDQS